MGKLSKSDEQKLEQILVNLCQLWSSVYSESMGYGEVNRSESRDHSYDGFLTPIGDALKFLLRDIGRLGYGFYPWKGQEKLLSTEEFMKIWMDKPEYQQRYNEVFGWM